ncbi:MAG TPA: carbohydrate kinase family protein, partial [Candidatus Saccharimonadales bacterium]|nr:carbohydrate kinase family protein [Candidatus Saccharimonadales bacterium]
MFLKDLLENDHPLFTGNINQLERAAGSAGIDTRLVADITHKAHETMRALGLDPSDTTSLELYNALKSSVKNDRATSLLANLDYVLINLGEGPVSFNLQDVIENAHHELSYDQRHTGHAKRHLRLEIVKRYAEHDRTHDELVHKLAEEVGLMVPGDNDYPAVKPVATRRPTMLAIGDIFTDVFIRLNEEYARVDTDPDGSKRLSMPFGSKPPYDEAESVYAVGPSPNAAVSAARLGLEVSLMAWLGDDETGKNSIKYLQGEGISTTEVAIQENTLSSTYYVLRLGADRTILVKNENFVYDWHAPAETPDWVYLSLVSDKSWQLHQDLLVYLSQHPEVKLAFQPGTFHFKWGAEKLADVYRRAYIVVMNREEAAEVTGKTVESLKE